MLTIRASLVEVATSLLTGLLTPDEAIESAPADTYLTGILWPRGAPIGEEADDAGRDGGGRDDEGAEAEIPGYRAIRPCSIGITLSVKANATLTIDLGETSRYEPTDVTDQADEGDMDREASNQPRGSTTSGRKI